MLASHNFYQPSNSVFSFPKNLWRQGNILHMHPKDDIKTMLLDLQHYDIDARQNVHQILLFIIVWFISGYLYLLCDGQFLVLYDADFQRHQHGRRAV